MLIAAIVGAAACRAIMSEFRDAVHRSPLCGACGYSRLKIPDWQPCPECGVDRPDALELRLTPRPWRVRWAVIPLGIIGALALVFTVLGAWSVLGWAVMAMFPFASAMFVERRARVSRDRVLSIWFVIAPLTITIAAQFLAACSSNAVLLKLTRVPYLWSMAYTALVDATEYERVWMVAGMTGGVATIAMGFWQALAAFFVYARMDRDVGGSG